MKQLLKLTTLFAFLALFTLSSCGLNESQQTSDSGVTKASTLLKTGPDGLTIEQKNIIDRLQKDNNLGAIKHLYIISSYTGDVLEYSTVRGKVTSGSKRLSPKTVKGSAQSSAAMYNNWVRLGEHNYITDEVLDDGGAYGESANYIYWFDAQDNYQQYFPAGGTYLHISDRPLKIRKANFSFESDVSMPVTVVTK